MRLILTDQTPIKKRKSRHVKIFSTTGPTEQTPKKPEYLIALISNLLRGPLGFGPIQFLMDMFLGRNSFNFPKLHLFQVLKGPF